VDFLQLVKSMQEPLHGYMFLISTEFAPSGRFTDTDGYLQPGTSSRTLSEVDNINVRPS